MSTTAPETPTTDSRWLTVSESAVYLKVHPQSIRNLIHRGDLRASKLGQNYRVDRIDLDQLLIRRKRVVAPYRRGTKPHVAARHARNRKLAVSR